MGYLNNRVENAAKIVDSSLYKISSPVVRNQIKYYASKKIKQNYII